MGGKNSDEFRLRQLRHDLTQITEILFNKKIEDRISTKVPYEKLKEQMAEFVDRALLNTNHIISLVFKTDTFDDYTIGHSLNVCMLSILIGDLLGYNRNRLTELGLAALLHDIGKRYMPSEILFKGGKLTDSEFEVVKQHPENGINFMNKVYPQASDEIKRGILEHHERLDGQGYPKGLKDFEISDFARIIAITDIYEAFTSIRAYHDKRSIEEGINCIRKTQGLDTNIVNLFTENSVFYPHGMYIVLSDQTIAIVKGSNTGATPEIISFGSGEPSKIENRQIIDVLTPLVKKSS